MKVSGMTDKGLVRTQNQDAYFHDVTGDTALCAVCDGMGGARAGNVASALAINVFSRSVLEAVRPGMDEKYMVTALTGAVGLSNDEIYKESASDEQYSGMGTTLVAVLVQNGNAVAVNVGDSRAYLVGASGIRRITRDHSVVEDLFIRGELTADQARAHPSKNLITRALGTENEVACDIFTFEVSQGDLVLLCSDGLSNLVLDDELLYEVAHKADLPSCCRALIEMANERGGSDNISVVLLEI